MAERRNGLAALPAGLMRPTTPTVEPVDDPTEQGGDSPAESRATKPRRKRQAIASATHGRKLHLPDDVYERLVLTAIKRKTTASAIAADVLDRNLPRLRIEQEG
jgi:hypothetical protein